MTALLISLEFLIGSEKIQARFYGNQPQKSVKVRWENSLYQEGAHLLLKYFTLFLAQTEEELLIFSLILGME